MSFRITLSSLSHVCLHGMVDKMQLEGQKWFVVIILLLISYSIAPVRDDVGRYH
jgi:hypothetical protein